MHTLYDEKYVVGNDALESDPQTISINEWTPLSSSEDNQISLISTDKPLGVNSIIESAFDRPFSDVRPVCEQFDELGVQPTLFVYPAGSENELTAASNANIVVHGVNGTNIKNGTNSTGDGNTEKPNYPAYFIKQQQQMKKFQLQMVRAHQVKNQEMKNKTELMYGTPTTNKTRSRGNQRGSSTSTTITSTSTFTSTATPITTTLDPVLLYQPINGSDDGFRPMLPSEINKMKLKNRTPVRIRLDPFQAQASNVQLSVVPAPSSRGASATSTRKAALAAKKTNKAVDTKSSATKPTNSTSSPYTKTSKNMYRGAVKFGDSVSQVR